MTSSPLSDPIQYAPVSRPYRHWLAWSLALLLHLVVIGVVASRQFAPAPVERSSIDVVLVSRPSPEAVEASAIAEADQRAAGSPQEQAPAEARAAPMDELPELQAAEPEVDPATPAEPESAARPEPESEAPEPPAAERPREAQATPVPRDSAPQSAETSAPPTASAPSASGRDLLAQATSSIREQGLSSEFAGEQPGEGRQAAQQAAEARYIDDWTRRVEDYGNRVHPAPRHLEGQLRIRVVIGRDGQVRQAEVVQSSGHAELDQAALDTVHGAAPYRPFDRGMGTLDSLSITRVWRFGQGNHYGVQ
ncbi:TonB family protein [Halomonas rhizosphaerae]|uniref:TonB family protein n=1 Tax=Halomonas rhizosphaerae TaxID=3043296 RepID=A0ABT6UYS7_9GAMM|nr:TonB family protein [Halomonas rhizosphaerae]MDI5889837.1 TonB family protein [Halomonas rhizosphaerae]MDI5919361.1 TonB family protein [Halomonas rhizosphaerae]